MMCFYCKMDVKFRFLVSLLQLGRTPPSHLLTHPLTSTRPPRPPEPHLLPRCPVTTSSTLCPSAWTGRPGPLTAWVMGLSPFLSSRWWESSPSPRHLLPLPHRGLPRLPEDSLVWKLALWWRWRRTPLCVVSSAGWVSLLACWSLWLAWSWWDNTALYYCCYFQLLTSNTYWQLT